MRFAFCKKDVMLDEAAKRLRKFKEVTHRSRALLDRTAEGGCPHVRLGEPQVSFLLRDSDQNSSGKSASWRTSNGEYSE
jgi:hypothetical protein